MTDVINYYLLIAIRCCSFNFSCVFRWSRRLKHWKRKLKFRCRSHSSNCLSRVQMDSPSLSSWKAPLVSVMLIVASVFVN